MVRAKKSEVVIWNRRVKPSDLSKHQNGHHVYVDGGVTREKGLNEIFDSHKLLEKAFFSSENGFNQFNQTELKTIF